MSQIIRFFLFACVCLFSANIDAQTRADADLFNEISKIKAIDNHAHPLKYVAPGEKPDDEFDALPLDAITAFPLPVRLSPTNQEFIRAWHDLYGYRHQDISESHEPCVMKMKQRVINYHCNSF